MTDNRSLFLAVLLGALATAIGMGTFLHLANADRVRLGKEIQASQEAAAQALAEKERVAAEASGKIDQANAEIINAQRVLADLEKERKLLATAVRLDAPATWEIRNWKPALASSLEVSLSLPPGTAVDSDRDALFSAVRTNRDEDPWLKITPYDARVVAELEASLADASERAYLVDGHLVSGAVGMKDGVRIWSFRVWHSASSTHAIAFTDPGTFGSGNGAERFLSTMTFGK